MTQTFTNAKNTGTITTNFYSLHTVGAGEKAIVTDLYITNLTGTEVTATVAVSNQVVANAIAVPVNGTLNLGVVNLNASEVLQIKCSVSGAINAFANVIQLT